MNVHGGLTAETPPVNAGGVQVNHLNKMSASPPLMVPPGQSGQTAEPPAVNAGGVPYKDFNMAGIWSTAVLIKANHFLVGIGNKNSHQYDVTIAPVTTSEIKSIDILKFPRPRLPYVIDRPTIIFGADVTHPHPGEYSRPSIPAVVASMDWPQVTKYKALVSVQPHRQEIISDLYKTSSDPKKGVIHGVLISEQELCSVGDDSCLILWDARTGSSPVVKIEKAHDADLCCVWNLIGENLFLTGPADNTNILFDRRNLTTNGTGSHVHIFENHTAAVLCWSPDKASVFGSLAENGVLNVWDHNKECILLEDSYTLLVTFIVVLKRHYTRFCPVRHGDRASTDRSGSILPGTVVDTKICHPSEFDFCLRSHAGIQVGGKYAGGGKRPHGTRHSLGEDLKTRNKKVLISPRSELLPLTLRGQLLERIHRLKLEHVKVDGDGNCLYRAFAVSLHDTEDDYMTVKNRSIKHMRGNPSTYMDFGRRVGFNGMDNIQSYTQFVDLLEEKDAWGNLLSLYAVANAYGVRVNVVVADRDRGHVVQAEVSPTDRKADYDVYASYIRYDEHNAHYDALIPREEGMGRHREERQPWVNSSVILVKNLPDHVTKDGLQFVFGSCGLVESVRLTNDGIAFIKMKEFSGLRLAAKRIHGKKWCWEGNSDNIVEARELTRSRFDIQAERKWKNEMRYFGEALV